MNTTQEKLSLWDALLININVMFGTGVLINTINIAQRAGFLGFLSYGTVALIMLPIIASISAVVQKYPEGGFYAYARETIGPWAGFLSAWTYFTGKLASASLLIHIFSTTLRNIIAPLQAMHILGIDLIILFFFLWLNQYNLKTGAKITYTFIFLKLTPVIGAILGCLYLARYWSLPPETLLWSGIPSTIPLVLYAFVGFEAACSLSNKIKDAQINAPKAILYSYAFVVLTTIAYQGLIFATLAKVLLLKESFLAIFPTLFEHLFVYNNVFHKHLLHIIHIAIATSALGGSYGILLSNAWNLHTLAVNDHIIGSSRFKKLNQYGVPFLCIIAEITLCLFYLTLTYGNQIALQQISVLGCTVAYTLSILGLLISSERRALSIIGLASCTVLLTTCIYNFFLSDIRYLLIFSSIITFGIIMFITTRQKINTTA